MYRYLILFLTAVTLFSCNRGSTATTQEEGDTVVFKYATQLSVVRYDGYAVASLKNPWKPGKTLHQGTAAGGCRQDSRCGRGHESCH